MAIRTYDILLDSYNSTMPEPIVGRQGDKNGAVTLHVTITDRGSAVDLTGQTVNLMAETAKGTAIVADNDGVTVTNATDGKFDYAIPNALWSEAGKITKAYFSLNGANGQQTTYDLIFIIKKAVDISQGKADDYVTIVDGTLRSLKEKINAMNTDFNNGLSTKVNTTDMRKPASDVAGIEEVNAKQDKIGYTPADDSKVAHLSGANNFDTVPTVNNNPLLLASSLPSDIARTGSDQEFTGKNTFDVAPIDKTTGNPYITKDGVPAVPSTLADTTKLSNFTVGLQKGGKDVATTADVTTAISTATANMVDSSKPTNFTAGLQSGGVDVATAADLKSVEASAWRPLTLENSNNGIILFKDNGDGTASLTGSAYFLIASASGVITEAIDPPSGYQFSSLAWNKGTDGDGIFAMGGSLGNSIYTPGALINNGKICFKRGSSSNPQLMFYPCLKTTDKTSSSGEPAIVKIKKV